MVDTWLNCYAKLVEHKDDHQLFGLNASIDLTEKPKHFFISLKIIILKKSPDKIKNGNVKKQNLLNSET